MFEVKAIRWNNSIVNDPKINETQFQGFKEETEFVQFVQYDIAYVHC